MEGGRWQVKDWWEARGERPWQTALEPASLLDCVESEQRPCSEREECMTARERMLETVAENWSARLTWREAELLFLRSYRLGARCLQPPPPPAILFVPSSMHDKDVLRLASAASSLISLISPPLCRFSAEIKHREWKRRGVCNVNSSAQMEREETRVESRSTAPLPTLIHRRRLTGDLSRATGPLILCATETDAALCSMSFSSLRL